MIKKNEKHITKKTRGKFLKKWTKCRKLYENDREQGIEFTYINSFFFMYI